MQFFIGAAIVCGILLYLAVRAIAHLVMTHLLIIALAGGVGIPVLVGAGILLIKGMLHHTAISWNSLPPAQPRGSRLPMPVRTLALDRPQEHVSPFSTEFAEQAEARPCEGPECLEILGEQVWTVDALTQAEGEEPVEETHSFCSRECAERFTEAASTPQVAEA